MSLLVLCFRRLFSRKKAAQRAKRMAGQGLGPWGTAAASAAVKGPPAAPRPSAHLSSRAAPRRGSPTYDYHSRSVHPIVSAATYLIWQDLERSISYAWTYTMVLTADVFKVHSCSRRRSRSRSSSRSRSRSPRRYVQSVVQSESECYSLLLP